MTYKEKIKELRSGAQETKAAINIKYNLTELKTNNNSISSYRWIWELIQNAKDCTNSTGSIDIEIDYNKSNAVLEFKHNGKLFSTKNIVYLVEQVSTKERTREAKSTGKFGTGFLTTHLLSPKVCVSGYLQDEEDKLPASFCVEIDRSGEELDEIKSSIKKSCDQLESTTNICETSVDELQMNTIFKYILDKDGMNVAENGLSNFIIAAPYVFAFVSELRKITINYDGIISEYTRIQEGSTQADNVFVSRVIDSASNKVKNIFTITNKDVVLAVEIKQENGNNYIVKYDNRLPKIFCDFPLLGTHDFSFPVVITSQLFNPNEPRNGVFLADNESDQNKELMITACELYNSMMDYFLENEYKSIYNATVIPDIVEKEWLDTSWYNENIISSLKKIICALPLFKMHDSSIKPLEDEWGDRICLLKDENPETRNLVWHLASQLFPENHIQREDVNNWYESLWSDCKNYGILELINDIENLECMAALNEKVADPVCWINQLIDLIYTKCRDNYAIINRPNKIFPNQNGAFCCITDLKTDTGIDEAYKETALTIGLDLKKQLLDMRINISGIDVMSFDDVVNQMNNALQCSWGDKSDFYKSILGLKGKSDDRQDTLINIYNRLYPNSPISSVSVSKCSHRLLNSALEYCSEELCKKIDGNDSLDILLTYNFSSFDETEVWFSNLIHYLIQSEKTEWFEKYAIIPNQNGVLKKKSDLYRETDVIPEFLKDACRAIGVDIKNDLVASAIDVSKVITKKKGYKEVSDIITHYVRTNKNRISLPDKEKQAFNETYFWLRENKDNPSVNCFFEELMQHLYWFYNDDEISVSVTKASEYDSILQRYGISDTYELEKILSHSNEKSSPVAISESVLCQYGISSEDDLKQLIEGKILGEDFLHDSEKDIEKFKYVQELLKRSHDRIQEHLKGLSGYNLDDSVDVHKTIFTAKKDGKEIYVIARPSDYEQVILYYGAEIDTLDYTQDFELWVENGKTEPQKLTFGKILRLTGVNRIPLRSIRNHD